VSRFGQSCFPFGLPPASWDIDKARQAFRVPRWSEGYVDIDDHGDLLIQPTQDRNQAIRLTELVRCLKDEGMDLPVLARFPDLLRHRLLRLNEAFADAMHVGGYTGAYLPLYPVKVNQQRTVIQAMLQQHSPFQTMGLEVGSKAEFMLALGMLKRGDTLVCNGYKDREYIRLALIAHQLGIHAIIVLEQPPDLGLLAEQLGQWTQIQPALGIRVRLESLGKGKWQNSGGELSKFGLSACQLLEMINQLERLDLLQHVRLLHSHLGSQVAALDDLRHGMAEIGRYWLELNRLGLCIDHVDVGGGLGVDYQGTESVEDCSMNYDMRAYAACVVDTFAELVMLGGIPAPVLMTEVGRAMTAHHAVLLTQVTDVESPWLPPPAQEPEPDAHASVKRLWQLWEHKGQYPVSSLFATIHRIRIEAQSEFVAGTLGLSERVVLEKIFNALCHYLMQALSVERRGHRQLWDELEQRVAYKYFCNFSLFQSLPDAWAIDQIFPIMPIERLNERPNRRAILQDLTCDSDGHISHYIDEAGIEPTMALHSPVPGRPYILAFFMVGAYQEILGDPHNLFGNTHAVNVVRAENGIIELTERSPGQSACDMLRQVHVDTGTLRAHYQYLEQQSGLEPDAGSRILDQLTAALESYTYLLDR